MSITPQLTELDRAVLGALGSSQGRRAAEIARTMTREVSRDEMWLTLRGLEHFGYASQVRGWWRRTKAGDAVLARERS